MNPTSFKTKKDAKKDFKRYCKALKSWKADNDDPLILSGIPFVGLMGLKSDGTLITPKGKDLIKLPLCIASKIQRIQHFIAKRTWH